MEQSQPASERKLAAIMFTDMVGFSALTQRDEAAALRILTIQSNLLEPILSLHGGRLIRTMGDGTFIEFQSAVSACRAAIEIQSKIAKHNLESPERERFQIRIGIHLGDVEVVGDDLLGHGVNVAARIEPLAEAGGICISDDVARQVRGKIPGEVKPLGNRNLKGIAGPIEVFTLSLENPKTLAPKEKGGKRIAVFPLVTPSGDSENEFFADGITEEILWALAKVRSLRVVSRTSCFALKGASMPVKEVGKLLGVEYVLEGSVRRAGNRVRIAVQLVEIEQDRPIWSDRFDRDLEDIFQIQEEITSGIVDVLQIVLSEAERGAIDFVPTRNLAAYEHFLKGISLANKDMRSAVEHLQSAVELDPNYAKAYAGLAYAAWRAHYFLRGDGNDYVQISRHAAQRANELDPNLVESQLAFANLCELEWKVQEAFAHLKRAQALDPRNFDAYFYYAQLKMQTEEVAEACEYFMKAGDLRPDDYQTYILAGTKFIQMGDERGKPLLEEGVARVRQRLLYDPQDSRALCLAAGALVVLNQTDEARRLAERAYEIDRFSTTLYNLACFYSLVGDKERAIQMLQEAYEGGLRNANWIHTDAEIDPIRDDPRVQEIISKMESDVTPRPG